MKKTMGFLILTIGLMAIIILATTMTVQSKNQTEERKNEAYYYSLEREYVAEMREYLDEEGFLNSGVMLTRVVSEDGTREYTITIHNNRFDRLSAYEKEILIQELTQKAFKEENCSFVHSLTGNA